jgi:uncharacterized protein
LNTAQLPEFPDARLLRGAESFNAGDYYAAHDIWEDLWRGTPSPTRQFYHSLIHAAVAFYHQSCGRCAAATKQAARGRLKASAFAPDFAGFRILEFWNAIDSALATGSAPPVVKFVFDSQDAPKGCR